MWAHMWAHPEWRKLPAWCNDWHVGAGICGRTLHIIYLMRRLNANTQLAGKNSVVRARARDAVGHNIFGEWLAIDRMCPFICTTANWAIFSGQWL